jgi:2-polyprenyl-6-hydroxyphenyl methylase/3-demethylubiquinone-9 3-methyltransferase
MTDFSVHASDWWNPSGPLWTLHALQGLRDDLLDHHGPWTNVDVLDVGCGGGLSAEAFLARGARVVAFDVSPSLIDIARTHDASGRIDYRVGCSMDKAMYAMESYGAVVGFEVLEHLEHPEGAIDNMIASLRPGGTLMLSSPQRGAMGYVFGIVVPEYVLGWLPVGTHRYHMLVSLQDIIAHLISRGLSVIDVRGMWYYPSRKAFDWCQSTAVHYTVVARKPL